MSAKEESSRRRSVETELEVPGTQSADRRAVETALRTLMAKFAPAHLPLLDEMRGWLRKRLPTAYEVAYEYRDWFVISYSPSERGYEGVLSIRGSADGVKLYFTGGNELPDPEKLLKGSAQVRFIHMDHASTLALPAVERLVDEAIARNTVPFADSGSGSVVIRSALAKQRPRGRTA